MTETQNAQEEVKAPAKGAAKTTKAEAPKVPEGTIDMGNGIFRIDHKKEGK